MELGKPVGFRSDAPLKVSFTLSGSVFFRNPTTKH